MTQCNLSTWQFTNVVWCPRPPRCLVSKFMSAAIRFNTGDHQEARWVHHMSLEIRFVFDELPARADACDFSLKVLFTLFIVHVTWILATIVLMTHEFQDLLLNVSPEKKKKLDFSCLVLSIRTSFSVPLSQCECLRTLGRRSMTALPRGNWREEETNYLSTKIWQMIQSNNTKSENLEGDITEILEKTFLLWWSESKKSISCWIEKEEEESASLCRDLLGLLLLKWPVLWSGQLFLVSGLLMERVLILVAEWISLEEMLRLQELSSAVSVILKEWLDDQILDSFEDCGVPVSDSCIRTSFSVSLSQCECFDVFRIPVRFFLNM